ncbi:unnamed protein product [Rhizophagus irregularis]|uniref:Uncharacterized protein n=1 Tax=Rhizophagus irregularis TaxID=588596 RepID=A0A915YUY4_9GLOM|nr:unnamed protein product [Rhizophagus irregularis]CAB5345432.1 unnamed protein product [Rhizophagus irregularis]
MSFTFDLINVCNSKLFFTSYIAIQEKIRKNLIKNFYVKKIQMIQLKNYLLALCDDIQSSMCEVTITKLRN